MTTFSNLKTYLPSALKHLFILDLRKGYRFIIPICFLYSVSPEPISNSIHECLFILCIAYLSLCLDNACTYLQCTQDSRFHFQNQTHKGSPHDEHQSSGPRPVIFSVFIYISNMTSFKYFDSYKHRAGLSMI
jgi:hypothetical protein